MVDEFGIFSVVIFGLVVVSIRLVENEVVGVEKLIERISMDSIYGIGFKIDEDGVRNVFVVGSLEGWLVGLYELRDVLWIFWKVWSLGYEFC